MTMAATTWKHLDLDVRRHILQKMNADDRLLLWMSCNDDWSSVFPTQASRDSPDHVAKLWSVRDAELERRMEAFIERQVIAAAAALRGYRDKVFPLPGSYEADNWVASYAIKGGDAELFRDIIAEFPYGAVDQGELWMQVIAKDDPLFADLMLQLCIYPGARMTYRMVGLKLAIRTARELVETYKRIDMSAIDIIANQNDMELDPRPTLALEMSTYGIREMLIGCVAAPISVEDTARTFFDELMRLLPHDSSTDTAIIDAILESPHEWRLGYLSHFPRGGDEFDDSEILTYIARRAIETKDDDVFRYLIDGAMWGEWALADPLLWTVCEYGTAEQVMALLDAGAPRSAMTYYYAAQHPLNEGVRIIDALLAAGVPLEDENGSYNGLLGAVMRDDVPLVRRFLDLGVAVTYHTMDFAKSPEVYSMLMEMVPLARREEYGNCAFYNAMSADAVDRVLMHFDVLGRAPTTTIYHQCLSMDAVNVFTHFWREGRYLEGGYGLQKFENGLAMHPELCKYVWENPRAEVDVDWTAVILHASVGRYKETLDVLEALYEARGGGKAWANARTAAALRRRELHPPLPFQGFPEN